MDDMPQSGHEPSDNEQGVRQFLAQGTTSRRSVVKAAIAGAAGGLMAGNAVAQEAATPTGESGQPNIVVIMADDIGYWNTSAYNLGMMGYQTPNIDQIARDGMLFTDAYGEQSCTAGRAAFITGQHPFRTGLLSIGMPGQDQGLQAEDPTLAELLKPQGYATGQFGKNHLGDLNKYLPTVHGFDEFFGNLYHLNAEEEPENEDYPDDPEFFNTYGPRGVLHTFATDIDDPTEDPRFGPVGKQTIEDTGPLDTKRMETIDEELLAGAFNFIDRARSNDQPFFLWFNPTRMHVFTHLKPESQGVTGLGIQADGMVEHDGHVGQLLQKLDDLGISENTIVIYATDNGAQVFSWPDGNMTPFRGEKNSNWEGAYRVPMMVRWPNHIPAGSISNGIFSLQDWVPTLMAAVGVPDIKEQLLTGYQAGDKSFKVHLDGYNQLDHLTSGAPSARSEFFYFSDDGDLVGLRQDRWKFILQEQRAEGMDIWFEPLDELRGPRLVDLRGDPFERALEESENYNSWLLDRIFVFYPARGIIQDFMKTFVRFPPRQSRERVDRVRSVIERLRQPGD
ncbi:MAG: arylsulfatase [Thermomicrobiales bacterium]